MTRFVANGLTVSADFQLPGLDDAESAALPRLAVTLTEPCELGEAWSGCDGPSLWQGRLGDGQPLKVERGALGDFLYTYGDRAQFLLGPAGDTLLCAPTREALDWQRVLLSKVLPIVSVLLGYEALHASAVESPQGTVAILAPSGIGKTTLAAELMRRGWPLVCDDILTLGASPDGVLAHPGTPHMNLGESGIQVDAIGESLGVLAGERWIAASAYSRRALPVCMICLLERGPEPLAEAQRMPQSPIALAPYMLGLHEDSGRQARRFSLYAELAGSVSMVALRGGRADLGREAADLIVSELEAAPTPMREPVSA